MADTWADYAYPFAAWDVRLYLDTHPDDAEALETYRSLCRQARNADRCGYACISVPEDSAAGWTWISDPWPWESAANTADMTDALRAASQVPAASVTPAADCGCGNSCGCNSGNCGCSCGNNNCCSVPPSEPVPVSVENGKGGSSCPSVSSIMGCTSCRPAFRRL